jgi:hypothetical protein
MFGKQLIERLQKENIHYHIWGKRGKTSIDELEQKLNFKFDPQVSSFIEEIGNLGIPGLQILIAGSEDGTYNCITETEDVGLLKEQQSPEGVKIMDNAGLSYILYADGSIKAYEHDYTKPDGIVFSYLSFSDFIASEIKGILENP